MSLENIAEIQTSEVKYTSILFASEVGLGSILHSFKIPLSGHLLSLNQIFWLTRYVKETRSRNGATLISTASSLLKTLSPAGKKLTPMVAILGQGICFNIPIFIFGNNLIAYILGASISSLWAFLQPLILFYVIFGETLIKVSDYYLKKLDGIIPFLPNNIFALLSFFIFLKLILATFTALTAFYISHDHAKKFERALTMTKSVPNKKSGKSFFHGLVYDFTRPIFVISMISTFLLLYYSEDKTAIETSIIILRPLTIALIIFSLVRLFPVDYFTQKLRTNSKLKEILKNFIN